MPAFCEGMARSVSVRRQAQPDLLVRLPKNVMRTLPLESTATVWGRARNHIEKFFGPEQQLRDVTVGQAKEFRRYLLTQLAEDTTRRTCGIVKQFPEDAIDHDLVAKHPFKHRDIPTATGGDDKSREYS